MGRSIKAVFFDMDDTLVLTGEADSRAYEDVMNLARRLHEQVDAHALLKAWKDRFLKAPWDFNHKVPVDDWRAGLWHKALLSQGIYDMEMAKRLQDMFRTARLEHFVLEHGVNEMIEELRSRGLKAVIITNGHPEIQRGKLERVQAAAMFDGILVGGEEIAAGAKEKPAASIFLKACELAGCLPSEAVHIGDSLAADIQGGINAGLAATIWVNRLGHPLPRSRRLRMQNRAAVTRTYRHAGLQTRDMSILADSCRDDMLDEPYQQIALKQELWAENILPR